MDCGIDNSWEPLLLLWNGITICTSLKCTNIKYVYFTKKIFLYGITRNFLNNFYSIIFLVFYKTFKSEINAFVLDYTHSSERRSLTF